jgi:type I restriction enzyme R subunit
VFGKGNDFAKKITYKTYNPETKRYEKSETLIQEFRTSPQLRIAVTVDMIATGTDIKPLECLLFLRDVRSRVYFEQMKGRGTPSINSCSASPSANATKTRVSAN